MFKAGDELQVVVRYSLRDHQKATPSPSKVMSRSLASIWRATWWALTPSAPVCTRSFAQALETSMVCEIPFETLDDLSGKMPNLRQQNDAPDER